MAAENSAFAEILQSLFQTPPAEFTAERNKVVKALKSDGDKELAATVAAVRRPGMSDWLLNVASVEYSDEVAELVEAANEVIDSQEAAMEGHDTGDLRIRLKLLRVCAATVATVAGGIADRFKQAGAGSSTTDITTRLTEIAANRGALALLERGLLGAEDPGSSDPFAAIGGDVATRVTRTEPAKKQAVGKAKPAVGKEKPARDPQADKPSGPTAAERKARRAAVATAQKALAAAESASDAATRAVTKHETVLARAEARAAEAEAQLGALKAAVATVTDALHSARADENSAAADVDTANSALVTAERALVE